MKPIPLVQCTHTNEAYTICTVVHILMKPIPFVQQYTY